MNAVKQQGIRMSKASIVYGVPRNTLKEPLSGKVCPGAKSGESTLPSEEKSLLSLFVIVQKWAMSRQDMK